MPTLTFRREGGIPRGQYSTTCSHTEIFTVTAPTEAELWALAAVSGKNYGGALVLSGIDNTRSAWEEVTGEPTDPKHAFKPEHYRP